ncbi:hypothetical protein AGLY_018309 [Aphis glycines]|uniref:C2H2-type domain-containing protein n=1 Tax=Aphis glycines TaxID=307491 RepID=A0A6G0SSC5_APHGL|nr:hypothetical protein AGLY_018309 [Aphis glycines]
MSYGFLVKSSDDVQTELIEEYEIPTVPYDYGIFTIAKGSIELRQPFCRGTTQRRSLPHTVDEKCRDEIWYCSVLHIIGPRWRRFNKYISTQGEPDYDMDIETYNLGVVPTMTNNYEEYNIQEIIDKAPVFPSSMLQSMTDPYSAIRCTVCAKTFKDKSNLRRHLKKVHAILHAPTTLRPQRESVIKYAPRINRPAVPDVPTGSSNIMSVDDICMTAMDNFEQEVQNILILPLLMVNAFPLPTPHPLLGKKKRINFVQTSGFVEISTSKARTVVWYYAKNTGGIKNYTDFLRSLESELKQLLKTRVQEYPIKLNLKLEASYSIPSVLNSLENRAFKTSAVEIYVEIDIPAIIQGAFDKLLSANETYVSRGSGFTLESIDGLLLTIYKYMPIGGSSYMQLPAFTDRKRATINPQNLDQQCFKWAILARHVVSVTIIDNIKANIISKSSGHEALEDHKLFCGAHKPIFPEIPKEEECTNF